MITIIKIMYFLSRSFNRKLKMVNTCFVPFCKTGYKKRLKNGECSLEKSPIFKFPTKNPYLLKKWKRFLNRNDTFLLKNGGICANHFEKKYLKIGQKRNTLKWELRPVPTIYTNSGYIPASVFPTPTSSRNPPSRNITLLDQKNDFDK